jgi:hypothetical protein
MVSAEAHAVLITTPTYLKPLFHPPAGVPPLWISHQAPLLAPLLPHPSWLAAQSPVPKPLYYRCTEISTHLGVQPKFLSWFGKPMSRMPTSRSFLETLGSRTMRVIITSHQGDVTHTAKQGILCSVNI